MTGRTDIAAARVLGAYDGAGRGARAHVRTRWRSCPFPEVAAAVPPTGRTLDLGCGHGVLSLYLAATGPGREVVGVDVDGPKLAIARAAAQRAGLGNVGFPDPLDGAAVPPGPWDAICVVDVLYLLGRAVADGLLTAAAAQLAPGGVLLVKEIDDRPRWKYALAKAQELVATRVLRITEGSQVDFVPLGAMASTMSARGLDVTTTRLDRGRLHPHALLTGRRP